MSLQTDIEAITGSISDITTEALEFCKEGNKYVQRIIAKNPALSERLRAIKRLLIRSDRLCLFHFRATIYIRSPLGTDSTNASI